MSGQLAVFLTAKRALGFVLAGGRTARVSVRALSGDFTADGTKNVRRAVAVIGGGGMLGQLAVARAADAAFCLGLAGGPAAGVGGSSLLDNISANGTVNVRGAVSVILGVNMSRLLGSGGGVIGVDRYSALGAGQVTVVYRAAAVRGKPLPAGLIPMLCAVGLPTVQQEGDLTREKLCLGDLYAIRGSRTVCRGVVAIVQDHFSRIAAEGIAAFRVGLKVRRDETILQDGESEIVRPANHTAAGVGLAADDLADKCRGEDGQRAAGIVRHQTAVRAVARHGGEDGHIGDHLFDGDVAHTVTDQPRGKFCRGGDGAVHGQVFNLCVFDETEQCRIRLVGGHVHTHALAASVKAAAIGVRLGADHDIAEGGKIDVCRQYGVKLRMTCIDQFRKGGKHLGCADLINAVLDGSGIKFAAAGVDTLGDGFRVVCGESHLNGDRGLGHDKAVACHGYAIAVLVRYRKGTRQIAFLIFQRDGHRVSCLGEGIAHRDRTAEHRRDLHGIPLYDMDRIGGRQTCHFRFDGDALDDFGHVGNAQAVLDLNQKIVGKRGGDLSIGIDLKRHVEIVTVRVVKAHIDALTESRKILALDGYDQRTAPRDGEGLCCRVICRAVGVEVDPVYHGIFRRGRRSGLIDPGRRVKLQSGQQSVGVVIKPVSVGELDLTAHGDRRAEHVCDLDARRIAVPAQIHNAVMVFQRAERAARHHQSAVAFDRVDRAARDRGVVVIVDMSDMTARDEDDTIAVGLHRAHRAAADLQSGVGVDIDDAIVPIGQLAARGGIDDKKVSAALKQHLALQTLAVQIQRQRAARDTLVFDPGKILQRLDHGPLLLHRVIQRVGEGAEIGGDIARRDTHRVLSGGNHPQGNGGQRLPGDRADDLKGGHRLLRALLLQICQKVL